MSPRTLLVLPLLAALFLCNVAGAQFCDKIPAILDPDGTTTNFNTASAPSVQNEAEAEMSTQPQTPGGPGTTFYWNFVHTNVVDQGAYEITYELYDAPVSNMSNLIESNTASTLFRGTEINVEFDVSPDYDCQTLWGVLIITESGPDPQTFFIETADTVDTYLTPLQACCWSVLPPTPSPSPSATPPSPSAVPPPSTAAPTPTPPPPPPTPGGAPNTDPIIGTDDPNIGLILGVLCGIFLLAACGLVVLCILTRRDRRDKRRRVF